MADQSLVTNPDTLDQLKKLGLISDETYSKAQGLVSNPTEEEALVSEAKNAPVRPEYLALKQADAARPKNFLAPDTTQEKLNELDQLRATPSGQRTAMQDARLKELESMASPIAPREPASVQPKSVVQIGQKPQEQVSQPAVSAQPKQDMSGYVSTSSMLPSMLSQQADVFKKQEQANRMMLGAEAQKAKGEVAALQEANNIRQQYAAKLQIDQQREQDYINGQMQKMQKFTDDIANGPKIDPDRWMNSKSTGQRIALGIGMFLGGFDKNGNQAADMVRSAINADIDAQKADYQRKVQAGQMADNVFTRAMQMFQSEKAAKFATLDSMLAMTDNKMKMEAAKYGGAEAQAKYQAASAMIQQQRVDVARQWQQMINTEMAHNILEGRGAADSGVDQDPKVRALKSAVNVLPKEEQKEYLARQVQGNGVFGFARTAKQAEEAQKTVNDTESAIQTIDELMKLGQDPSNRLDPNAKRKAESLQILASGKLREPILGPGTMQQQEYERLMKVLGNPTDLFNITNMTALKTLKDSLLKGSSIQLKNIGVQKVWKSDAELGFQPGLK